MNKNLFDIRILKGIFTCYLKTKTESAITIVLILSFFKICVYAIIRASHIAQLVKNPPAMQETQVRFLGQEDLMVKG